MSNILNQRHAPLKHGKGSGGLSLLPGVLASSSCERQGELVFLQLQHSLVP